MSDFTSKPLVFFLISFFLLCFQDISAQSIWYEGEVVLRDGKTLKGNVSYDIESEIVSVRPASNEKMKVFRAHMVDMFYFYDTDRKLMRSFFTLTYQKPGKYEDELFFELIIEGEMTLLSKEFIIARGTVKANERELYYEVPDEPSRIYKDYFYILYNNRIEYIKNSEYSKEVLGFFTKGSTLHKIVKLRVRELVKDSNLKLETRRDMTKLIREINEVIDKQAN